MDALNERSPCLECPDLNKDKNRDECVGCRRRLAYAAGDPNYMDVPVGTGRSTKSFYATRKSTDPIIRVPSAVKPTSTTHAPVIINKATRSSIETRACKEPDCPMAGKPQPLKENFQRHAPSGGYLGVCKACMRRKAAKGLRMERTGKPSPTEAEKRKIARKISRQSGVAINDIFDIAKRTKKIVGARVRITTALMKTYGLTMEECAEFFGCHRSSVQRWRKAAGIKGRILDDDLEVRTVTEKKESKPKPHPEDMISEALEQYPEDLKLLRSICEKQVRSMPEQIVFMVRNVAAEVGITA